MTRHPWAPGGLLFAILLGVAGCGSSREESVPDEDVAPAVRVPDEEAGAGAGAGAGLAGTSWRLVKFEGGDETVLTPDDPSKYTFTFEPGGRLTARIDCNRGMGTWKSSGPPELEFGPLALSRAMCPPGSLHDQIVRQLPYVRSYVMRDGHLYMALMADGGIYELEPVWSEPGEGGMKGAVRGTASWRERMALPTGAVLEATVEDVSRADAPAEVIGQVRVENPGNPPVRFEIPYDRSLLDPARTYAVRAKVTVDGKPFFTTDRHYPVLGADGGETVELMLRRTGSTPVANESLENTYWRLTHLHGAPVSREFQREPHLIFNAATGRASGSGGCNQVSGSYQASGDSLALSQMVGTLVACDKGMETEQAFLQALEGVSGWRISGRTLELLDRKGTALARFEGTHMR